MFNLFSQENRLEVLAPITGDLVELEEVPDQVFSQKMMGDGIAINPTDDMIVAPCEGQIVQIFDTNHAVGIETKEGIELLIHIGIDTVELAGQGFTRIAQEGVKVKPGDELIKIDKEFLVENAPSLITPLIVTDMSKVDEVEKGQGSVTAGQDKVMDISL
ncbi:PTS glucose transporter subunit IIA [Halanaerocella petrolearia]